MKPNSTTKKSKRSEPTPSPSHSAIISPAVDFFCCGGLSILVVIAILSYAFLSPQSQFVSQGVNIFVVAILGTLINAPHFMASYVLLYQKRTQITQHRLASTYIPLMLFAVCVYAFATSGSDASNPQPNAVVVELLAALSVTLLAWHYTGQAWGMTASFAYISGIRMEQLERWLIRCGYHALLVWHILWACLFMLRDPGFNIAKNFSNQASYVESAYNIWSGVVLLTIPLGIAGFIRIRRRTGIAPPLRCYAPWIAIYLWYALIWAYPGMFPLLQIFHALQYLVFPLRVEINQYSAKQKRTKIKKLLHGIAYYLILVVIGLVVFELPLVPLGFVSVIASFINIHHFFIDGAIWKIRNPDVRKDLFAHLKLSQNEARHGAPNAASRGSIKAGA